MKISGTRRAFVCACILALAVTPTVQFAQIPRPEESTIPPATPKQPPQPGQASGESTTANPPGSGTPPAQPARTGTMPLEFQSRGLNYEALSRDGITVMFAVMPSRIHGYNVVQVTVTNGSPVSWVVRPTDFSFVRQDNTVLNSVTADDVVGSLLEDATRKDVIKLQLLYEDTIYALANYRPTNGYEQRREAAMAQFVNPHITAAVAASAVTFAPVKLNPGDSTDGAVFFENRTKEKVLGSGRLVAHTCGQTFEFPVVYIPKLSSKNHP